MTQRVPWSVKGITREDRELAKAAAQKAGLSVGAWLTQQIRQAAEAPSPAAAADPSAAPSSSPSPSSSLLPSAAPPRSSATWAARAAAAAAPETPRFAFGPGRWQRAAAAAVDGTPVKKARGDAVAGDEIAVTEPAAPAPAARHRRPVGRRARRRTTVPVADRSRRLARRSHRLSNGGRWDSWRVARRGHQPAGGADTRPRANRRNHGRPAAAFNRYGRRLEHGRGRCHQIASDRRSTGPPAGAAAGRPGPDRRQRSDPCRPVDHRPGDHALGGAVGSFGNPPPAARILAAFVRCRRQTPAKVPAAQDYPASSPKITA